MTEEIRRARCCEFCQHWKDRDEYMGVCELHTVDTTLTDVCNQWEKIKE